MSLVCSGVGRGECLEIAPSAKGHRQQKLWEARLVPGLSWSFPALPWAPRTPSGSRGIGRFFPELLGQTVIGGAPVCRALAARRSIQRWAGGSDCSEKCKRILVKPRSRSTERARGRFLGAYFKAGTCAVEKLAATWWANQGRPASFTEPTYI